MQDPIFVILITLFISFVIFLIMRELWCWYWKINTVVSLLEKIHSGLQSLCSAKGVAPERPPLAPDKEICPFCREPSSKANRQCDVCGRYKR